MPENEKINNDEIVSETIQNSSEKSIKTGDRADNLNTPDEENNLHADEPSPESLPLVGRAASLSLTVDDIEESAAWYCNVLGFTVQQKHEREGRLIAISLASGDVKILVTQDNGARGAERVKGEGFSVMITTTQNIDALAAAIKSRGGILENEPVAMPWGQRMFRLRDPDGFKYTIASEASKRDA